MARRTRNRMELRDQYDAAERRKEEEETDEEEDEDDGDDEEAEADDEEEVAGEDDEGEDDEGEDDDEEAPKKKKKKAKVKVAKPKTRTRAAKVVRMRVVWGVFNNSHQCVATYDYPKRADADQHAARLTTDKRSTHFVQPVKEPMEDKKEKD
jgi:cobalamin biosynthesis protein CobT